MRPFSFEVARRLSAAHWVSGETIARELDVTRATVWLAVRDIERAGARVHRVRGRGYRLAQPLSLLDAGATAELLGRAARRWRIEVHESVDSTNRIAFERAESDAPDGTVVAAELQRAGRGRLGRAWLSELGGGLTFSVLWRFRQASAHLSGLSLAVGVAVANALRRVGARDAALKWPNDLVLHARKLGGVLTEIRGDMLGPSVAVIGIGINVRLSPALRRRIDQPVADLHDAGVGEVNRNVLLAAILSELATTLERYSESGFPGFRQEWQALNALQFRPVRLLLPNRQVVRGKLIGVDDQGALRVETAGGGVQRFFSGELTLRAARSGASRRAVQPPLA